MKLYNLARMTSATTGTGTLTLGVAVSGYLTFSGAGVSDGDVVLYGIKDGSASEVGWGTYTASGTTLSRNVYKSTNSNALVNCDGSQEVYITALAGDGGDLLHGTSNPMLGFDMPLNLQLNASNNGTKLTIAVKGNNGGDPSTTNPVLIPFRDATLANGDPAWVAVTAALSVDTNAAGASLGTQSGNVPFRLWVVAFNDGGTVKLALWQSVTWTSSLPTAIAPLYEAALASATAFSGSANQPGIFYTQNGVAAPSSKAFRILGYVDYASGLATAGTYASNPTTVQLFGPGIKKPGDTGQCVQFSTTSTTTTTGNSFVSTNLTQAITPSATPNLVRVEWGGYLRTNNGTAGDPIVQMFRGSTGIGLQVTNTCFEAVSMYGSPWTSVLDAPGGAATYTAKLKNDDNATTVTFASSTWGATMTLTEIFV